MGKVLGSIPSKSTFFALVEEEGVVVVLIVGLVWSFVRIFLALHHARCQCCDWPIKGRKMMTKLDPPSGTISRVPVCVYLSRGKKLTRDCMSFLYSCPLKALSPTPNAEVPDSTSTVANQRGHWGLPAKGHPCYRHLPIVNEQS